MNMDFEFFPLTEESLNQITHWRYADGDSLYMQPYLDCLQGGVPLRGPGHCEGFAVYREGNLIGLFEYSFNESALYIGLALAPPAIGQGLSTSFILEGIAFGVAHYNYPGDAVYLEVEKSNTAALSAYKKVGFSILAEAGDYLSMSIHF